MTGRERQKQRTRQLLVDAYNELVRGGQSPSVAQVAEAAEVSVATAYRYFPNPESLRADAAVAATATAPDFEAVLAEAGDDPVVRIEALVRAIATWQMNDEPVWRGVLRATLERWFAQYDGGGVRGAEVPIPVRSNARAEVVRLALRPLESELSPAEFGRLVNTVMLTCGVEALITTRDAAALDPDEARETMVAAARTLVLAARKN